ncbi:hypothetical protein C2I36_12230 [Rhodobacteraceae bacterium WD3A24]|nr:hypothetical protein C2I36_12230 [Rhodobacteraceae bacterium WD3A24]
MSYDSRRVGGPGIAGCSYGTSRLVFRGPRRNLEGRYIAALGGTETFGKFIARPYPALVETATGWRMVNLGCPQAGPDAFLRDPVMAEVCAGATAHVVQVMGAASLSNPYYAVHPRRNDRFLGPSADLCALYPELDFAEFSFIRHVLGALAECGPRRFDRVVAELRRTWVARMKALLAALPAPAVLLWMSDRAPDSAGSTTLGRDPLFVDATMLEALRPDATEVITVVCPPSSRDESGQGLICDPLDRPAARHLLGPAAHEVAAAALAPIIEAVPA